MYHIYRYIYIYIFTHRACLMTGLMLGSERPPLRPAHCPICAWLEVRCFQVVACLIPSAGVRGNGRATLLTLGNMGHGSM